MENGSQNITKQYGRDNESLSHIKPLSIKPLILNRKQWKKESK